MLEGLSKKGPGPSIPEKQIVPKYFGVRLRFRGRQFSQGQWGWGTRGEWFRQ